MTMVPCIGSGFGAGGYGLSPFGGAEDSELQLIAARAVRENVVRLFFNQPVYYSGVFDFSDAADPERYVVYPDSGIGYDGNPPRAVSVILAAQAFFAGAGGKAIDVTVDRPFTPYPARYGVSAANIRSSDGFFLSDCAHVLTFFGTQRLPVAPLAELQVNSRDIANPQTLSMAEDPNPNPKNPKILGTIPVDDLGDYGFDDGSTNVRKRCIRRLITRKGAFAWLPGYGVGTPAQVKKLGRPTTRAMLAAEAESQLKQEPEVVAVKCTIIPGTTPGLWKFRVLVKTSSGSGFKLEAPVGPGVSL